MYKDFKSAILVIISKVTFDLLPYFKLESIRSGYAFTLDLPILDLMI